MSRMLTAAFYDACQTLHVAPESILRRSKVQAVVRARDAVIARMYAQPGATLESVGEWFGMHHTSIIAAVRRQKRRECAGANKPLDNARTSEYINARNNGGTHD